MVINHKNDGTRGHRRDREDKEMATDFEVIRGSDLRKPNQLDAQAARIQDAKTPWWDKEPGIPIIRWIIKLVFGI